MTKSLFCCWLTLAVTALMSSEKMQGAPQIEQIVSNKDRQNLSSRLQETLHRYELKDISVTSDDYRLLDELRHQPELAFSVLDDLILLTTVREQIPDTTEQFSALRLSPAGGVIVVIGPRAIEKIEASLKNPNLDPWSRLVLDQVRRTILDLPLDKSAPRFNVDNVKPNDLFPRKPSAEKAKQEFLPSTPGLPMVANAAPAPLSVVNGTPAVASSQNIVTAQLSSYLPVFGAAAVFCVIGWALWKKRG